MRLLKQGAVYLASGVMNKALPLLLLPALTRYLIPEDFGVLAIFLVLNSLCVAFIGMGIAVSMTKRFYVVSQDEMARSLGSALVLLAASTLVVTVFTLLYSQYRSSLFSVPMNYVVFIPITSFFMAFNALCLTLMRNQERAFAFGLFEVANGVLVASTTLACLILLSLGWQSQVAGYLVGHGVFFIVSVVYLRQGGYLRFEYCSNRIKSILTISLPVVPHAAAAVVISVSDRLFIEHMVGLEAVSMYTIGYTFGMIPMLGVDAFIKAWNPWFYRRLISPSRTDKGKIVKYTYLYLVGVFAMAILVAVVAILMLPMLLPDSYSDASSYILWIALGYATQGSYKIFLPYLVHIGKTSFLAFSTGVAAVLNIVMNYFLIAAYGAIGAAYATLISFLVSAILVFLYQAKKYPMPWALWKLKDNE